MKKYIALAILAGLTAQVQADSFLGDIAEGTEEVVAAPFKLVGGEYREENHHNNYHKKHHNDNERHECHKCHKKHTCHSCNR